MRQIVLRLERRVKCRIRELRRQTDDKGLAMRCQIVLLAGKGRSRKLISDGVGCSVSWINRVLGRFCDLGVAGLMDRREDNGSPKIDEHFLGTLHRVVGGSPRDYGQRRPTWTRELLVKVMAQLTGMRVHVTSMSRALKQIRARRGRPRPTVNCPWPQATKNRVLSAIRLMLDRLLPTEAAVYMDEADIHLNPKIGLDWMNRGQQKEVLTPGRNVKRYICGAMDANRGQLSWVIADRKNSLLVIETFKRLLAAYPNKRVIHVILDNYSIHSSKQTALWLAEHGQRLRLHFLPPYCPNDNKIERLWEDLHANVTRNHACGTIDELIDEVVQFVIHHNREVRRQAA